MSQDTPRKNPPFRILLSVFLGTMIVSGAIIFAVFQQLLAPAPIRDLTAQTGGVREITPPRSVTDFSFPSQTGDMVSLSDYQGKFIILYFGYTHCPDVCLLTLVDFMRVHEQLGEMASEVEFIFVSVDGERDTPPVLANYLEQRAVQDFMTGLSGDEATLQRISVDYDLFYELHTDEADSFGNYPVDHTASIFLLDQQRRLTAIFAYGTNPEIISDYLLDIRGNTQ